MPIKTNENGQIEVIIGAGDICSIHVVAQPVEGRIPSLPDSYFGFIESRELVATLPTDTKELLADEKEQIPLPGLLFRFYSATALHALINNLQNFRDSYYTKMITAAPPLNNEPDEPFDSSRLGTD